MIAGDIKAKTEADMVAIIYQLSLNGLRFSAEQHAGEWLIQVVRPT